jgi:predicted NAD/FAD-binding protein
VKIAIVGAGIAGLGTAYLLSRAHDVELFEREPRLGGHAHTHCLSHAGHARVVDTGFLVFNERTYPNFVRLLGQLGVEKQASDMSFGVRCRACGLEYSTRTLATLFAQPWRIADPRHLRMLRDTLRFFGDARRFLGGPAGHAVTLGQWLDDHRYGAWFARHFLLPLTGAVWSASFDDIKAAPARTLLHFMDNHGMLTATDNPPWFTVRGGSRRYVEAIAQRLGPRIQRGRGVVSVKRQADGVDVVVPGEPPRRYDHVVLATHADEALALLVDPSPEESRWLGAFRYSRNRTVLHTDVDALPRSRRAWASWNSDIEDCADASAPASLTYLLNRLQSVDGPTQYCVSLNRSRPIGGDVLASMDYTHPILDAAAVAAQPHVRALNGTRRTFYAGAHLRHGFHEDGLVSAIDVASHFGIAL